MKEDFYKEAIRQYIESIGNDDGAYLFDAKEFSNIDPSIYESYIDSAAPNFTNDQKSKLSELMFFNPVNFDIINDYSKSTNKLEALDYNRLINNNIDIDRVLESINNLQFDGESAASLTNIIKNQKYILAASVSLAASYYEDHAKATEVVLNNFHQNLFSQKLSFGQGFSSIAENTEIFTDFIDTSTSLEKRTKAERTTSTDELFDKISKDKDFSSFVSNTQFYAATSNIMKQAKNKSPLILTEEADFLFNKFPALFMAKTKNPEFVIFEDEVPPTPEILLVESRLSIPAKERDEYLTIESFMDDYEERIALGDFGSPPRPGITIPPHIPPSIPKPGVTIPPHIPHLNHCHY